MKLKRYFSPFMRALFPAVADSMTNAGKSTAWAGYALDPKPSSLVQVNWKKSKLQTAKGAWLQVSLPTGAREGGILGGRQAFPLSFVIRWAFLILLSCKEWIVPKLEEMGRNRVLQTCLKICCASALKNNAMNFCFFPQLENGRYSERQATSVCSQCKEVG